MKHVESVKYSASTENNVTLSSCLQLGGLILGPRRHVEVSLDTDPSLVLLVNLVSCTAAPPSRCDVMSIFYFKKRFKPQ